MGIFSIHTKRHINVLPTTIQRDWMFHVEFDNPGPRVSNLIPIPLEDYTFVEKHLKTKCKDFQAPAKNIKTTTTYQLGKLQTHPLEEVTDNEFTLTFEENNKQDVLLFFNDWINLVNYISNPDNGFRQTEDSSWKDQVKTDVKVYPLDADGSSLGKMYKLYDCYPVSIPGAKLDYSSNSSVSYAIKFEFSYMEIISTDSSQDWAPLKPAVLLPFLKFVRPQIAPPLPPLPKPYKPMPPPKPYIPPKPSKPPTPPRLK